jgi:amino acid adenylation domain-containing protein
MDQALVEGFQLSPLQRRLWTLDSSDRTPYRSRCEVRICGRLDVQALRESIDHVAARHEILRTTFHASPGMTLPVQVVGDSGPVLRTIDVVAAAAEERTRAVDALRERSARRRYDFARGPLASVELLALAADEHLLLIDVPALCGDGSALRNLVAEIARQYGRRGRDAAAADDDAIQYIDASEWLNETLTSGDSQAGREFWQRILAAAPLGRRLPFERPAPTSSPFETRRAVVSVQPSTWARLRVMTGETDGACEAFLLTCLQVLFQRVTGTTEVAVACAWSGRAYSELDNAIGLFARTLPLPGPVPDDLPFADAVRLVGEGIAHARTWGVCFDWSLVPNPSNGTAQPPFAPFAVQHDVWPDRYRAGDVEFALVECESLVDRFKLKLVGRSTTDEQGSGALFLDYDARLYDEADVTRLADQLAVLVEDALERPGCPVGDLRVLPEGQRDELMAWASTPGETFPAAECVHRLFEQEAVRTPGSTAVVCEDDRLSYEELNARANQLAHYLRGRGVAPGVLVGLCLERSVNVMVGILAVMKAGGAYLPLDPRLPRSRVVALLEDSGTRVVVADERVLDRVSGAADVVLLDRDRASVAACPAGNPGGGAEPDDLAYVLFTSGSTGRPKGVAVEHRQLAHYVHAIRHRLGLPGPASFATVTTFAADLGNTSIYPALLGGGCLHIVTESCASDPGAFAAYQRRHRIDVLKIVPSHLRALLSCAEPQQILPRQRLVLGGEACPWELVDEVRRLAPELVVFNHYGPTETTVGATTYRIGPENRPELSATVPIGRPLADVRTYVLGRDGELVPCWFPGELYIGGAGVARGYFDAAAFTSERFVPDPRSNHGGRLYRTGDEVRFLPTGDLEFLGRRDDQVKIRGFRVELGEVETALNRHAAVRQAAVVIRGSGEPGGGRLVACVVPDNGSPVDPAGLSAFLRGELPEYMVPGAFVPLDSLPLTPNGKIDRKALADLADAAASDLAAAASASAAGERPSGEWEITVAEIWRELLETDQVGAHDNFYDLGGHSLLAIQVVTALERRTQLRVSPRDLVFHTLRQFAALCESRLTKAVED